MGLASEIVAMLNLPAHPEGGFYSETFRDNSIVLSKSQLPPKCDLQYNKIYLYVMIMMMNQER